MTPRLLTALTLLLTCLFFSSCGSSDKSSEYIQAGKYTILGTKTDNADVSTAKKNAESTLLMHPDINAMVGLWAYNIPQCMEAVIDAGKLGTVKLFSFDEDAPTLQGIKDGHIYGTIVQQPFVFGYKSMEHLIALANGDKSNVGKSIFIDTLTIKKHNVDEFWTKIKKLAESDTANEKIPNAPTYAFVTNGPAEFWNYARAGAYQAARDLKINCDFRMPSDASAQTQVQILESMLSRDEYKGVAVSPLDPDNQISIFNTVAEKIAMICVDSDAPGSNRQLYLGTDNYMAGRMLGKLVKEGMPEGGKLMIYVGKMDVLNAQERRQGLIDELSDAPLPAAL